MDAIQIEKITLEEYTRLYETEGAFEIINGQRIKVMPTVAIHVVLVKRLLFLLELYAQKQQLGEVFSEAPFVLTYDSNWVRGSRVPDVMFFAADRLSAYKVQHPDWLSKPFILVPDLAVEVISTNDVYTEVMDKVEIYLQDGVKLIWVVNPKQRSVTIFTAGSNQQTRLIDQATLDGGAVMPGFSITIASIFE